jgi:hypothetical protein
MCAGFAKNEDALYRNRIIELKHGRVAMLAILGTLTQTFYHLPDPVFSNPRPLAALSQILADRPVAFWQLFLTIGAIELTYVCPKNPISITLRDSDAQHALLSCLLCEQRGQAGHRHPCPR